GPGLYVGGWFHTAGGQTTPGVARWSGSAWSSVGAGLDFPASQPLVNSFVQFDDGSGSALYVGGVFELAGGQSARNIAKWNGTTWSHVGSGLGAGGDWVNALSVFDDGSAETLIAGGRFWTA